MLFVFRLDMFLKTDGVVKSFLAPMEGTREGLTTRLFFTLLELLKIPYLFLVGRRVLLKVAQRLELCVANVAFELFLSFPVHVADMPAEI